MLTRWLAVGAFLFLMADGAAAVAADPPARVSRLSFVEGTVSLRPSEQDASQESQDGDWKPATVNYPVTSGNSLWTESGAKAEVQVGPAEVRLNEQTELEVMRLDDNTVDLTLHQGTVNVHVGSELPGGLRIDTPRGPVSLMRPGSYRIDVDASGDHPSDTVQVAVFDGEAQVAAQSDNRTDTHTVRRGESLKLAGTPTDIVVGTAQTSPFDQWAKSRDPGVVMPQQAEGTVQPMGRPVQQTTQYVSPQATGYQDLAGYGTWEPAPNYGTVWYPARVVDDWAPYRYGHWEYIRPWGWTWIDDAPWGFTPFHYGRWVRVGHRWAWWPGARAARPVYAPALVAFVGGNGWSVSITSGRARPVGWVPLAPYEVYHPHYRTSATYIRNVNITTVNRTVINNITVNKNVEINKMVNRNAATVVSADSFRRGQKVNEAKIDVARKDFDKARVTNDVRRIEPERVAARAEAPHPAARQSDPRKDDSHRAPNPAVTSHDQQRGQGQDQGRGQQRDQRRDAAPPAAPQNATKETGKAPAATPQAQPQEQQRREQAEQQQRRQRDEAQDQQRREQAQQQQRQRDQAEQQQREQADKQRRDQTQEQQRQRDVQDRQQRDQAEQRQHRQRDDAEQQQRREQARERRPDDRTSVQPDQQQQRQAQDNQRRQQAEAQQRQQAEQQQRRAQAEQQQRQQAEQQQRQAQDHQHRQQAEQQQRQQAEQQQRQQAEQQQRQTQEQQQRQQRDQAQQQQQRQQQEQAREEQKRRGPDNNRPDNRRDRAG